VENLLEIGLGVKKNFKMIFNRKILKLKKVKMFLLENF
jgi:hypothetical protein